MLVSAQILLAYCLTVPALAHELSLSALELDKYCADRP
jgi:hypothetical protein